MTRIGILFSGRGSNMAALLDAAAQPGFPGQVAICLTNVADAPGLLLAQAQGDGTKLSGVSRKACV